MIAYDLDGVFVNDLDFMGKSWEGDPSTVYNTMLNSVRNNVAHALFVPKGRYYIITGRPLEDLELTERWARTFLSDNPPEEIFMGVECHSPSDAANFKAGILNMSQEIGVYVESCPLQAEMIKTRLARKVEVVHFSDFVNLAIERVFSNDF